MDFSTLCIHSGDDPTDCTGSVTVPIYQTATFSHLGVGKSTGYDYSRLQNPTREHLEKTVAKLEHGDGAIQSWRSHHRFR
jgi:cystathionine gamma-synthase